MFLDCFLGIVHEIVPRKIIVEVLRGYAVEVLYEFLQHRMIAVDVLYVEDSLLRLPALDLYAIQPMGGGELALCLASIGAEG